jgi:RNA-binding protein
MTALTSGQRAYLRREAHDLKPTVQVGKGGVSEAVIGAVAQSLALHELIKVKFLDAGDEKRALAEQVAADTDSALVAVIGSIAILYRPQDDPTRRKVMLPAA